jgi:hypothetical protein
VGFLHWMDHGFVYPKVKMAQRFVVFIALLLILVSISGCPSMTTKPSKPRLVVEAYGSESTVAEPNKAVLSKIKQTEVEPNHVRPEFETSFHGQCAEILNDYVNESGMVDYKKLKREGAKLTAVLKEFENLDPNEYRTWPREDKIAFWINAYNLHKLKIVSANYPIQASSRFLRVLWGPTDLRHIERKISMYKFLVLDEEFTFKKIENRFFRGQFDDPRIFLTLSDACLSSPPLRNEPYYGYKLNEQLDNQTRRFLSGPDAFKIDRSGHRVYLSAIFEAGRYGRDFFKYFSTDRKFKDQPSITRAVLNFITHYVSQYDVTFLEVGNYSVKYMTYDWTINDGS